MKKIRLLIIGLLVTWGWTTAGAVVNPVDYVSTLVGTQSKHALSTGNTYPAIALPWGYAKLHVCY